MSVYVLCGGWDYEGETVLGVYASADEARAAGEGDIGQGVDFACVYEFTVGAPVEVRGEPLFYIDYV